MQCKRTNAFTLAELLIALAILGVIATFTIPKVLNASQDQSYNAIGKETFAMVSGAFQAYQLENQVTSSTSLMDLTPFMNYVSIDTVSVVDQIYNVTGAWSCTVNDRCLRLHNGAVLRLYQGSVVAFGGENMTNALLFHIDPNGVQDTAAAQGNGKTVEGYLYFNGRITSRGGITPNTCDSVACRNSGNYDPPWLQW